MFSFEVAAEDYKKEKKNYLHDYKYFNVYIKCTAIILSDSLTDIRHNSVPKAKTQESSKSLSCLKSYSCMNFLTNGWDSKFHREQRG
jgi:hypothetical protein